MRSQQLQCKIMRKPYCWLPKMQISILFNALHHPLVWFNSYFYHFERSSKSNMAKSIANDFKFFRFGWRPSWRFDFRLHSTIFGESHYDWRVRPRKQTRPITIWKILAIWSTRWVNKDIFQIWISTILNFDYQLTRAAFYAQVTYVKDSLWCRH